MGTLAALLLELCAPSVPACRFWGVVAYVRYTHPIGALIRENPDLIAPKLLDRPALKLSYLR